MLQAGKTAAEIILKYENSVNCKILVKFTEGPEKYFYHEAALGSFWQEVSEAQVEILKNEILANLEEDEAEAGSL